MNKDTVDKFKTLGPQAAYLVGTLYEYGKPVFSNADVMEITGLEPKSARNFVASLVKRGVASRLKPGLFILVPYELGFEREYMGNPYVIARELSNRKKYYISHGSAMDIHQMLTQPQLKVFASIGYPANQVFCSRCRILLCPLQVGTLFRHRGLLGDKNR